jgi:hypothetical protein
VTWPFVHPLWVHYPVALLTLAAPAAFVWSVRPGVGTRAVWVSLSVVGFAGAVAAYLTGGAMVEADFVMSLERIERHELLGEWTMYVAGAQALLAGSVEWSARSGASAGPALRAAVAALSLGTAVLTGWTAHLGASDVWPELVSPADGHTR